MIIYQGDCLEFLRRAEPVKCLFADPPDNIGMNYNNDSVRVLDKRRPQDYYDWLRLLVLEALPKCQVFWLSYYPEHDLEVCHIVRDILKYRHPSFSANKFIWRYTFSQYNDFDCSYGYRPILRLLRFDAKLYPDRIREISRRQELGDLRTAHTEGRVPDNVWSVPRVVGNSPERATWMPTQHPIKLMERVMAFSVVDDEWYVDLFGGSGSSLHAAKINNHVRTAVVEVDQHSCEMISERTGVFVKVMEDGFVFPMAGHK